MRRLLPLLLLLAGCYSYVRPPAPNPLIATRSVTTPAGRLQLDAQGALRLGPAQGDIAAALGVVLAEANGEVTVAAVRTDTPGHVVTLEVGDALLEARPLAPWIAPDALPPGPGIIVHTIDDLRGLAIGVPDLAVALRVRRGGVEAVVLQPLREPELVATRPWLPELAGRYGLEVARLDDWPATRLPAGAGPEDYLVTRVLEGGAGALLGFRPLDVIPNDGGAFDLRAGDHDPEYPEEALAALRATPVQLLAASGATKEVLLEEPTAPIDVGFMDLFNVQTDGWRSRVGLLPLDLLFHCSTDRYYDPRTDTIATTTRWSFLTVFQVRTLSGGAEEVTGVRFDAIADEARSSYLRERMTP
jgi:hypothetical protein